MTREEYLEIRKINQFPKELLYEYYMENKEDKHMNVDFNQFLHLIDILSSQGVSFEHVVLKYDIKYEISRITKDNVTLLIY